MLTCVAQAPGYTPDDFGKVWDILIQVFMVQWFHDDLLQQEIGQSMSELIKASGNGLTQFDINTKHSRVQTATDN